MVDILVKIAILNCAMGRAFQHHMTPLRVSRPDALHPALVTIQNRDIAIRNVSTACVKREIFDSIPSDIRACKPRLRQLSGSPVRHVQTRRDGDVRAARTDSAGVRAIGHLHDLLLRAIRGSADRGTVCPRVAAAALVDARILRATVPDRSIIICLVHLIENDQGTDIQVSNRPYARSRRAAVRQRDGRRTLGVSGRPIADILFPIGAAVGTGHANKANDAVAVRRRIRGEAKIQKSLVGPLAAHRYIIMTAEIDAAGEVKCAGAKRYIAPRRAGSDGGINCRRGSRGAAGAVSGNRSTALSRARGDSPYYSSVAPVDRTARIKDVRPGLLAIQPPRQAAQGYR